jgi:hypothetical protein
MYSGNILLHMMPPSHFLEGNAMDILICTFVGIGGRWCKLQKMEKS